MSELTVEAPSTAERAYPTRARSYYVLAVLVAAYILSFVDRMILTMLVDPIKATLSLTDFEVSLIYGFAFSLCYTVLGLPFGWLADRYSRRVIIISGIVFWSAATVACGLARSFGQMFSARIAVGVGEASLTPTAHSLLSDCFPPATRPRALSIYTSGLYLGAGIGTFGGGMLVASMAPADLPFIGHREPWQLILIGLGLLGIPMALLIATLPDPRRGRPQSAFVPFSQVIRHIGGQRGAYLLLTLGLAILAILTHGIKAWIPSFLMRTYGWSPADVGLYFGLVLLLAGAGGVIGGGFLSEWLRRRGHLDANVRVGLIAILLIAPFGMAAPLMPTGGLSLAFYIIVIALAGMPFGAAVAAIMALSPSWMKAQASALFLMGVNLIGMAGGPMVVAAFTDFLFEGDDMIRYSLTTLVAVTALPSALIVWRSMKPYRQAIAEAEH